MPLCGVEVLKHGRKQALVTLKARNFRYREEERDGCQDARNPSARSTGHVAKEVKKGIKWTKKVEPALQKTLRAIPAGRQSGRSAISKS